MIFSWLNTFHDKVYQKNYLHGFTNAWVDTYPEIIWNVAKVAEYWLDSFYKLGIGQKIIPERQSKDTITTLLEKKLGYMFTVF